MKHQSDATSFPPREVVREAAFRVRRPDRLRGTGARRASAMPATAPVRCYTVTLLFARSAALMQRFSIAGTLSRAEYRFFSHGPGVCIPGDGGFPLPGPPMAISPRSTARGRSRRRTGHGCPPNIAPHCPRHREGGGGGVPKARARRGRRGLRSLGVGDRGGGMIPPSPSAPPPGAIATTVHCTGRSRERTGHGFPPGIAMTALAPGRGRGRSAQRGRGGGCRRGTYE